MTSVILSALNVLLVLVIWMEWRAGPGEVVLQAPTVKSAPAQFAPSPLRTLSLDNYQEIVSRPLFWSERRPLADAAVETGPAAPGPFQFVLRGVVKAAQDNHALLAKKGAADMVRVQPGDVIEGWRVEDIREDSVTFSRGGRRQQVSLADDRASGR